MIKIIIKIDKNLIERAKLATRDTLIGIMIGGFMALGTNLLLLMLK